MSGRRRPAWWDRVPVPVVGLLEGAAALGVFVLVRTLAERPVEWGEAALRAALVAVLGTAVAYRARLDRTEPGLLAASAALREGRLPDDGDPAELRAGLRAVVRRARTQRTQGGAGLGVLAAGALVVAVLTGSGTAWGVAVLAAIGAVTVVAVAGWRARDATELLTELDGAPAG